MLWKEPEPQDAHDADKPSIRFLITSAFFDAKQQLTGSQASLVHVLEDQELDHLKVSLCKHNVFVRHARKHFYSDCLESFRDRTLVDISVRGDWNTSTVNSAKVRADALEALGLLCVCLVTERPKILKLLGRQNALDQRSEYAFSEGFRKSRAKKERDIESTGIVVDAKLVKRFEKSGFLELFRIACSGSEIGQRLLPSIKWLVESRLEQNASAAVVKTAIALETLLVFDKSEPLARSLAQRTAFILSTERDTRKRIASLMKQFYEMRSKVVHGSKKSGQLRRKTIEAVDRLTVLLYLMFGANKQLHESREKLRRWFENQIWGKPTGLNVPFNKNYLRNALKLGG